MSIPEINKSFKDGSRLLCRTLLPGLPLTRRYIIGGHTNLDILFFIKKHLAY